MNTEDYVIKEQKPEYSLNYNKGYIGFTFNDSSIVSYGIAYFTRWDRLSDIDVSHALIVSDDNMCIEAVAGQGVIESNLDKYFYDEHTHIFFRKPKGWSETVADEIVSSARKEVGAHYADGLIVNDMMNHTFLGQMLNDLTHDAIVDGIAQALTRKGSFICSELAAYCLQSATNWPYNHMGVLEHPAAAITPQSLFEDVEIFELWKNKSYLNIK